VIRGVTVKALVPGTGTGIDILAAGVVQIENCVVDGWDRGIYVGAADVAVSIVDTSIRFSGSAAIQFVAPNSLGVLSNVRMIRSVNNLVVYFGRVTMDHSVAALASDFGVYVQAAGSELNVTDSVLSGNARNGAIGSGILRVSGNTITDHAVAGLENLGSGAIIETFGNNVFGGNASATSGTINTVALQ
jgi:hypothetical protein